MDVLRKLIAAEAISDAVSFYVRKIYKTNDQKKALAALKSFFAKNEDNVHIISNITLLSDLAAVFVDEPEFKGEYNKICYHLKRLRCRRPVSEIQVIEPREYWWN
jgi:hypothetical protein